MREPFGLRTRNLRVARHRIHAIHARPAFHQAAHDILPLVRASVATHTDTG